MDIRNNRVGSAGLEGDDDGAMGLMRCRNFDCLDGTCGDGYGVEFSGAGGMRGDMVRAVATGCLRAAADERGVGSL